MTGSGVGPTSNDTSFPARLLIDLPNWLGDLVMALPAVHRLVSANSEGETVIHARPSMTRFLTEIYPTTRAVHSRRRSSPFRAARRLREIGGRFDVGVTLRNAWRAKIALFLAARNRLGSTGQGAAMLLSNGFEVDRSRHQVHDADPALQSLGLEPVDAGWHPQLGERIRGAGEDAWRIAGIGAGPVVGLAPGTASGRAKQWSAMQFGRLATALQRAGAQPVVIIGPQEDHIASPIADAAGVDLPIMGADLDVAGLAGILCKTDVVVGIDSGPVHLAAAVGTRVVALFGPTSAHRTEPLGDRSQVLQLGLDCAPCHQSSCPLGHTECMNGLTVAVVSSAVGEVLNRLAT